MSATENVKIPLRIAGIKGKECTIRAVNALKSVGLEECLEQKVSTLSGGEQQRVSIAKALVKSSEIILADEPTGSLDSANSKIIMNLLVKLNEIGKIIIIITHDTEISSYCKRLVRIIDGELKEDFLINNRELCL